MSNARHGDEAARELVAACRALYDAIDRLDIVAADRVGISRNDLRALNALEQGPLKPRDLAEVLGLTTGSVTSLIDRLEARGLLGREPDPDDRRGVLVMPTKAMFQALAPLYISVAQQVARLAEDYGPENARLAAKHLRDIAAAYDASTASSRTLLGRAAIPLADDTPVGGS